jgi:hypothetical protein
MFDVRLLNGQVLFVDGVASEVTDPTQDTPTEPWKLVGAVFDVVAAELVDRIENVDVAHDLVIVDVDFVKEAVLLAYDLGKKHTVTVINPNNYFKMIPVTQGRLKVTNTRTGRIEKVTELASLPDLATICGDMDFEARMETLSDHNLKWYDSSSLLEDAYAKHQYSMEILAAIKPNFKPSGSGSKYSSCSHEILPWGTAQTVAFIDKACRVRDGVKPPVGYQCVDIGFGAGGYLMALALLTHHRGWIIGGVEREESMVSLHHEWMARVVDLCPGMSSEMSELKSSCIKGEVTGTNCADNVTQKIIQADFVFVNNFLFHDMFGRGAKEGSVNGNIASLLCGCKVGTWVVTTALLDATRDGKELVIWNKLKWKRGSFSWSRDDREVEGYLYHVVAQKDC